MRLKQELYEIIFEADTPKGKAFDVILLITILISILLVLLESVPSINAEYRGLLRILEWVITLVFTLEYLLRIFIVKRPFKYIFSFYGIIDLLAVLPTYLSLVFVGSHSLVVIRAIRLLRVFRIFKLNRYTVAGNNLSRALWSSREKIFVFLFFIINLVIIVGTLMYLIEGPENGFVSIPSSIYWAIVTMTTVGYGDISPQTPLGQLLASVVMIAGYAIIAVPTGIVTAEMMRTPDKTNTQVCPQCLHDKHDNDAVFCKKCGTPLNGTHQS
ncbi:ion transporter [Sunxiuqinia elliptica]|uniref:Voltage-gated potassium channel n=1 Tax=Sunxiuqinia elliptica TaxID=655355 RepID=A0A4R6HBP0_9BACT|nr:ion transporter [Sunxiuqinia elliptica]TDO05095.1 voltage-gated potassium channel [Sunxiuqinia elliptica]TDO64644.1 voltage-gated potassium channel [Sunxiuqinia elliptica]